MERGGETQLKNVNKKNNNPLNYFLFKGYKSLFILRVQILNRTFIVLLSYYLSHDPLDYLQV